MATDYYILTCCRRMGTWLIECRRENVEKATNGLFETDWESFTKSKVPFKHGHISNLCAIESDSGLSNDLGECIELCKLVSVIRGMNGELKGSNLFILPPLEYREELMST